MPEPTDQTPPEGWDELGEGIAEAVVNRVRGWVWAREVASLSGYGSSAVGRWVRWYRQVNAKELEAQARRQRKIEKKLQVVRAGKRRRRKSTPPPD